MNETHTYRSPKLAAGNFEPKSIIPKHLIFWTSCLDLAKCVHGWFDAYFYWWKVTALIWPIRKCGTCGQHLEVWSSLLLRFSWFVISMHQEMFFFDFWFDIIQRNFKLYHVDLNECWKLLQNKLWYLDVDRISKENGIIYSYGEKLNYGQLLNHILAQIAKGQIHHSNKSISINCYLRLYSSLYQL